jgi:hypothetical protein
MDILSLLQCLEPALTKTNVRHMSQIIVAMLSMTGRVTMLGISRWTESGGSYRTVQRFFSTQAIPWAQLYWLFFTVARDRTLATAASKRTAQTTVVLLDRGTLPYTVTPSVMPITLSPTLVRGTARRVVIKPSRPAMNSSRTVPSKARIAPRRCPLVTRSRMRTAGLK